MNPTQLTLNIDNMSLMEQSKHIKNELLNESKRIRWAHFYAESSDARVADMEDAVRNLSDDRLVIMDDFKGHCLDADGILNMLQAALYPPMGRAKLLVTTSYMPIEEYCEYLISGLNCDMYTTLNIDKILSGIHQPE